MIPMMAGKTLRSDGRRVVRGGSWDDDQDFARAAFRDHRTPGLPRQRSGVSGGVFVPHHLNHWTLFAALAAKNLNLSNLAPIIISVIRALTCWKSAVYPKHECVSPKYRHNVHD